MSNPMHGGLARPQYQPLPLLRHCSMWQTNANTDGEMSIHQTSSRPRARQIRLATSADGTVTEPQTLGLCDWAWQSRTFPAFHDGFHDREGSKTVSTCRPRLVQGRPLSAASPYFAFLISTLLRSCCQRLGYVSAHECKGFPFQSRSKPRSSMAQTAPYIVLARISIVCLGDC